MEKGWKMVLTAVTASVGWPPTTVGGLGFPTHFCFDDIWGPSSTEADFGAKKTFPTHKSTLSPGGGTKRVGHEHMGLCAHTHCWRNQPHTVGALPKTIVG